jgi:hypothetical protein
MLRRAGTKGTGSRGLSAILRQGWHLRAGTGGERIDGSFRCPAPPAFLKFPAVLSLLDRERHVRLVRSLGEFVQ